MSDKKNLYNWILWTFEHWDNSSHLGYNLLGLLEIEDIFFYICKPYSNGPKSTVSSYYTYTIDHLCIYVRTHLFIKVMSPKG